MVDSIEGYPGVDAMADSLTIYVSYDVRENSDKVQRVAQELEKNIPGVITNRASPVQTDNTQNYAIKRVHSIKAADYVLVCVTKRISATMKLEIDIAKDSHKQLCFILFEPNFVPPTVQGASYLDFSDWDTGFLMLLRQLLPQANQQAKQTDEHKSRSRKTSVPVITEATTDQKTAKGIFISYRRDDASMAAGRLVDHLIEHFGSDKVFMDIDTIEPGEDFVEVIEKAVRDCKVLLAVIGKEWLNTTDENGKRRLDNSNDFVRLEIATALDRGIRVIPVLVNRAAMPQADDLPEPLKKLARRNAQELIDKRFRDDVKQLIGIIEKVITS